MTSALTLFGIACIGTVFWAVSPELATMVFARGHAWHPLSIGLLAAAGQLIALVALFVFGTQLRRRWRWFDRKCERARERLGTRPTEKGLVVFAAAGLFGFPPVSVTAAIAPGLVPRPRGMLSFMAVLRVVRFSVLAAIATHPRLHWPPW
jgi:hypothetical protein